MCHLQPRWIKLLIKGAVENCWEEQLEQESNMGQQKDEVISLGAGVMGDCELPDVCAWNPTQVSWKIGTCSSLLSRFSRPHDEFPFEEKFLLFKLVFVYYWIISRLQNLDAACSVVHCAIAIGLQQKPGPSPG